jgi:hypothetical protein
MVTKVFLSEHGRLARNANPPNMAGGNESQRSDRFDLPKNTAFTFIIRMFWQFHAVTALRSRLLRRQSGKRYSSHFKIRFLIFSNIFNCLCQSIQR